MDELIEAIKNGRDDQSIQAIIQRLNEAGTDLNAPDATGRTSAHWAAQMSGMRVFASLYRAGVNLDAKDSYERTPVHLAAHMGRAEIVNYLRVLYANMDVADRDGLTPAHIAAHMGHAGVIAALAKGHANLDAADPEGRTPAHAAAEGGHWQTITALSAAGANLDAQDIHRRTPADLAASGGHQALADALIQFGEPTLLGQVTDALDRSSEPSHADLKGDLTCQITTDPYTSIGNTRPVKLPDGFDARTSRTIPGSLLSAIAAFRCMRPEVHPVHGRPPPRDPLTKREFSEAEVQAFLNSPGFVQGDPARLALVAAVGEACRHTDRSPKALTAAAAAAAQAVAAAAASAPRDFRAILAAQGPGAAAGAGGGATAGPRPDRSGPTP